VKDHSVLSFGYTRALWDGGNAEDVQRMKGYAEQLASYVVVTNSNKRHRLQPLRFAQNFEAIRPAPFHTADSLLDELAGAYDSLASRSRRVRGNSILTL
jgi:hypothetical protein